MKNELFLGVPARLGQGGRTTPAGVVPGLVGGGAHDQVGQKKSNPAGSGPCHLPDRMRGAQLARRPPILRVPRCFHCPLRAGRGARRATACARRSGAGGTSWGRTSTAPRRPHARAMSAASTVAATATSTARASAAWGSTRRRKVSARASGRRARTPEPFARAPTSALARSVVPH
jgi:hypothetical protein